MRGPMGKNEEGEKKKQGRLAEADYAAEIYFVKGNVGALAT